MNTDGHSGVGEAFRPPAPALPPWLPTRKRNRLPLDAYRESGCYFVTITTQGRRPWFRPAGLTNHCKEVLRDACEREGFELLAYCFMPDHVHVLVSTEHESDLVRLIHWFKQQTGWWFRNRYLAGGLKASPTGSAQRPGLWQKSYYDHILRREEDVVDVVLYILENPVRAGLANELGDYVHAWSAFGAPEPA